MSVRFSAVRIFRPGSSKWGRSWLQFKEKMYKIFHFGNFQQGWGMFLKFSCLCLQAFTATKLCELVSGWQPCQLFKNLRRFRDALSLHPQGSYQFPWEPPTFRRHTQPPSSGKLSISLRTSDVSETHSASIFREVNNFPEDLRRFGDTQPPSSRKVITFPEGGDWVWLWNVGGF
jgi:hypothetical protein